MKKYLMFIFSIVMVCSITFTALANENITNQKLQHIENITRNLIEYQNQGDYEKFTANFTEKAKSHTSQFIIENFYNNLQNSIGTPTKFKVVSIQKDNNIVNIYYVISFQKNESLKYNNSITNIGARIAIDNNDKIHGFYFYYLPTLEIKFINQNLVRPLLESIYTENDYEKFKSLLANDEEANITLSEFQQIKIKTEKNAGKLAAFGYVNSIFSGNIVDEDLNDMPLPVSLIYQLAYNNKTIDIIFVFPFIKEKSDIKLFAAKTVFKNLIEDSEKTPNRNRIIKTPENVILEIEL